MSVNIFEMKTLVTAHWSSRDGVDSKQQYVRKGIFLFLLFVLITPGVSFCQENQIKGGEIYSSNFIIDEVQRNFLYYIPVKYDGQESYPLVIFLHPEHSTGRGMIKSYGTAINTIADSNDCVIVYPDAVNGHWNAGHTSAANGADTVNDVGFMAILINYFVQVYHADARRVFVAGLGNGGDLVRRLACNISYQLAAVAAFSGVADKADMPCAADSSLAVFEGGKENPAPADIAAAIHFFLSVKR